MLVRFHGCLYDIILVTVIVMAAQSNLQMVGMLGEDSKAFLQFDLLPIQNMMSYNQHWHPLVEDGRKTVH